MKITAHAQTETPLLCTYQVRVFTGTHDDMKAGKPSHEHLVDVIARNPTEAELIACQMAAAVVDDGCPMASEVITDSTLTNF